MASKSKPVPMTTDRNVMAKKFKINDGSSKYVETATLLEPANNSASNQSDLEELREVSAQLQQIKKKFDEAKKLANKKQEELEEKRKEIEQTEQQEINVEGPAVELDQKLGMLQQTWDETGERVQEELYTQHSYKHTLQRMKKDFIASKIKTSNFEQALKNKQQCMELEALRQRKIKEDRLQSRNIFLNLMKNIEKEQRNRQEIIHELQTCITLKEASIQKRIERQRRNQEIAEAAANENKDSSELRMRETLLVQKLWNVFLRKKMKQQMENSAQIDEAFKAIKTETGVTDVQEMVKKFMTREETYTQLLVNVKNSENKVAKLMTDNDQLKGRLDDLKVNSGNAEGEEEKAKDQFADEDILEMKATIAQQKKDMELLDQKYKKIDIVYDQVRGFAGKVVFKYKTLADQNEMDEQFDTKALPFWFDKIGQVTISELKDLREKAAAGQEPNEHADDQFIEFATEAFIHKNIRVRPISGVTADPTNDGRASNVSRAAEDVVDGNENESKLQEFHIEDMRKAAKEQRQRNQDAIDRKKALEEKKAQKKN